MLPADPILLPRLIASLAQSAVLAQRQMNQAQQSELRQFLSLLENLPAHYHALFAPLAPDQIRVRNFDIQAHVQIEARQELGVQICVTPLNLSYRFRYVTSAVQESKLQVHVEQVFCPIKSRPANNHED